ncbi:MAG: nickel pincer cofactor biosynthesis protein LarB [Thermoplasmata archaeon]|nr:nickel pincer cofactor biosynthesis protein LarB [Thermoplasmata archaeon]
MRAPPGRRRPSPAGRVLTVAGVARYDAARGRRTGVPEVILAEGKRTEELVQILRALFRAHRGALVSRLSPAQVRGLKSARTVERLPITFRARERVAVLAGSLGTPPAQGLVAVVTAGTSDLAVAEEAEAVLEALGIRFTREYDVGVAGLHRLLSAVRRLERRRPDLYLAFAGREGALPTVLAGLVRAPVVGVPTSIGYGRGGRGEAALSAMLQSCAPIAVVNIDGGVPAALFAAQLLGARSRRLNPRIP